MLKAAVLQARPRLALLLVLVGDVFGQPKPQHEPVCFVIPVAHWLLVAWQTELVTCHCSVEGHHTLNKTSSIAEGVGHHPCPPFRVMPCSKIETVGPQPTCDHPGAPCPSMMKLGYIGFGPSYRTSLRKVAPSLSSGKLKRVTLNIFWIKQDKTCTQVPR